MALRTVGVRLTADVAAYQRNLRNAGQSTKDFVGEMDKANKAGRLDTVADSVGLVGLGLVGMAGYAVKASMDFEKSMSAVKAATHGSAAEMDQLREAALQAGKDTQYSATGAADAITELSKAGVATADVLNGGLDGALDLAAAGQLDVAEAAETAASAMTQFKLQGKDIPHVADLLSAAAGKAQGSVHDMGQALNQAGLIAAQTGLSIEETTGGLAAFASAGLMGSDAGTSFKQMLLMLQAPSDKSKKLMEELGISLYDSSGQFVGLTQFAGQLQGALKDLTPEARAAAMAQIFGADATRAASIMYEQGANGVQTWIDKVNDAGYAQETASKLTDNLAGDIERLKGEIQTLAIEAGSGANGGLRTLTQMVEGLVSAFSSMPGFMQSSLTVMAGIGGVVALAAAGWLKGRRASAEFRAELESMGPAGEKAAAGLQRAQRAAALAAAAFVGLEIAGAVFDKLGNASINVDKLTNSLQEYATTGKLTEGLTDSFGKGLEDFGQIARSADAATHGFWGGLNDLTSSIPGVSSVVDSMNESLYGTSFNDATERMQALDKSFSTFVSTQKDAKKAGELWNEMISKSGLSMEELAALLPETWKGLGELQKTAHGAADGQKAAAGAAGELAGAAKDGTDKQKEYKTALEAAADAARGQRDALVALSDFMKAETDPVFAFIGAQKDLAKAQRDAKKAQEDLDTAVDKHGRKSKEARQASEKLGGATRDLADAAIDLQGKTGALGDTFSGKLSPQMIDTLKAAKLTDAQIKNLEKQFGSAKKAAESYDGKYKAETSAPGAKDAKKELEDAWAKALGFDGDYKAKSSAPGAKSAGAQIQEAWNKANGFDGDYKAKLSAPGAPNSEAAIKDAWAQAKGFEGTYNAKLTISGNKTVDAKIADLLIKQRQLATGLSYSSARSAVQKDLDRNRQRKATGGPVYGAGTATSDSIPALLSNGEHVWTAAEVAALGGQSAVTQLRHAVKAGKRVEVGDEAPGFALGGSVTWPFRTDVSKTKIPEMFMPGPSGGRTSDWIVQIVRAAFPGMAVLSKDRPGARTLSGNRSYHSMGRAVDFPASRPLAEWLNYKYMARIKELITPWNDLNIQNGRRHAYSGAVYRQHNFAGGNAHDHVAMKNGGTIREPVFGVGASGRTYSLGENYQPERVIPNWQGGGGGAQLTVVLENHGVIGSQAEVQNWLTGAVDDLKRKGRI